MYFPCIWFLAYAMQSQNYDKGTDPKGFINAVAYYLKSIFLDFQCIHVYWVFWAYTYAIAISDRMANPIGL